MKNQERVLVVDDEGSVTESVQAILEEEGYAISTASSGEEALARMQHEPYDLVLTDLRMEGMDGLDLITEIKKTSPKTIVIMMTAYASLDSAIEAMRRGGYDYLIKPCSSEHLKMAIRRGLEKKRLGAELDRKTAELEAVNKELAERAEHICAIHQLSDTMHRCATLNDLLVHIGRGIKGRLGFDRVTISLRNKREGILEVKAAEGVGAHEVEGLPYQEMSLSEVERLLNETKRTSRSLHIKYARDEQSVETDGSRSDDNRAGPGHERWHPNDTLLVPLTTESGELTGIISVGNPKAGTVPSQTTIRTLETFANTAAAAIDRVKLEEERRRLRGQLIQSEKLSALGELISGVAHELNNPLTGVLGYSQLMMDSDCDTRTQRNVEKIYAEAARCQKIVNSLLSFARQQKPERVYVNVDAVIEGALNLRAYQLKVDGVEVIREFDRNVPETMADPHQLEQVFLNIIMNAHEAMVTARGIRRLTIRTEGSGDIIRIKFIDTGPGISHDNLKRIFDPFYTTKEVGQGTGLGLSLSYGFIQEHEGSIYATSTPGEGATFVIELPIKQEIGATRETTAPDLERASSRGSILVVDDEQVVLDLLADIISGLGHKVDTAENGRAALKLVGRNDYDLIVTDMRMPGMDGRQLHDSVARVYPDLAERMIFITGYAIDPEMRAFFDATGHRHIEKPFDINAVRETVQENLRRKNRRIDRR